MPSPTPQRDADDALDFVCPSTSIMERKKIVTLDPDVWVSAL